MYLAYISHTMPCYTSQTSRNVPSNHLPIYKQQPNQRSVCVLQIPVSGHQLQSVGVTVGERCYC